MRMTELTPYEARQKHIEDLQDDLNSELVTLNEKIANLVKTAGLVELEEHIIQLIELYSQIMDTSHEWYWNEFKRLEDMVASSPIMEKIDINDD